MLTMQTRFLKASEHEQWNRFVDASPQGDVFCYWWWLAAVTKGDFKILLVEENARLVAGIILPFHGSGRINQPCLTRTYGVLYIKPEAESPRRRLGDERRWLNALLEHVDINAVVQLITHHNFTDWLPFHWRGYRQTTRYTYLLNYRANGLEDMWAAISARQKRSVRKALKNHLVVVEGDTIDETFRFSCLSFERQNKVFPYSLDELRRLDRAVTKHGRRVILKVVDADQRVHAVNYVVYNQRSAYHLLSGGDPHLREQGGHAFLLWKSIEYFSDKSATFNFGGSNIQAIEAHYRAFGGSQKQYFQIYNEALIGQPDSRRHHLARLLYHAKALCKHSLRRR
jgi:hypothetical protein